MDDKLIYTGPDYKENWFFNDWYRSGGNARYWTWQVVLNLLNQTIQEPVIIETGCQRMEDDIGGGMSTKLFCEYISRYGGKLISVDINRRNLEMCAKWTQKYDCDKQFIQSDSVEFLSNYSGEVDLVYLDSYDYPIPFNQGEALKAQTHNLNELIAIEPQLTETSIVLFDDNYLDGGGKPRLAKEYLRKRNWFCLLDYQQSIWVRSI